jgi:hypothetical protein
MRVRQRIKFAVFAGIVLFGMVAAVDSAAAQNEPVIVVPGRPGVPVMMWGVDVSGAVLEGEFGLNRPGVVAPTVIMRYWPPGYYGTPGAYYPATGQRPRYGRQEVIPPANRRLPPPAEPYHRDWLSESGSAPVSTPVPFDPPQVIVAPQSRRDRRHQTPPLNP